LVNLDSKSKGINILQYCLVKVKMFVQYLNLGLYKVNEFIV